MCSGDCLEFETHLKAAFVIVRGQNYDHALNGHYFEQRLAWLVGEPCSSNLILTDA